MSDSIPLSAITKASVIFELIQVHFGFSLKNRLHVVPEVAMFRIGEDESIWKQAKTGKYDYQVYFDGEFLCWIDDADTPEVGWYKFITAFRDKYKAGRVHLDEKLYELDAMHAKKLEKEKKEKTEKVKEKARKKIYQNLKKS